MPLCIPTETVGTSKNRRVLSPDNTVKTKSIPYNGVFRGKHPTKNRFTIAPKKGKRNNEHSNSRSRSSRQSPSPKPPKRGTHPNTL